MKPRRVVYIHSIRHFGSTERYLAQLAAGLDSRYEPWLVAPDVPVLAPLLELGALEGRVVRLPDVAYRSFPAAVRALRRALRPLAPDVVHISDVDPAALVAARLAGVRTLVLTHHTPELRPRYNALGRLSRRLGWAMRPEVVFTSDCDRATGVERDPIPAGRSHVVPLAIDLDRFDRARADGRVRRELGVDASTPLVGTVGILKRQKAHEVLVEAAERVDAAFAIVGEGAEREALEREIRRRRLDERVFLIGQRDDVPEIVAELDVFALSSDFEGMCLAVAEALAAGTPVVATRVGGVPQTVVDGETGLLVPPRDAAALASAIRTLLEDRELAARLAQAGSERVRQLYAPDRMVEATAALYERLLAAR